MEVRANNFVRAADIAVRDESLQAAVSEGTRRAADGRRRAMFDGGAAHGQALRQQAAAAKRRALRDLPELLETAERRLTERGVQVLWAEDDVEARAQLLEIARRHGARRVVKSKSMMTEEIALNEALEAEGIEVIETDLGEYILQLNGERPSHIVAPVVHKSKASIRDLFVERLGMRPTDDAAVMTQVARARLREAFLTADMGISGGNFIVAESGTVHLVTNEGNGRMVTSLPRVHVAVVGIEKIVATLDDYATLVQVLARSASGQKLSVYNSVIGGARRPDDPDGPETVYVLLVDNGRSRIYGSGYAEALACIRCGACLNVCPVYEATGGHAYGWVYGGPIGAVVTPLLVGLDRASPLPFASTLCGACREACPVDIDLPRMLLDLRADLVEAGRTPASWNVGMRLWAGAMGTPRRFRWAHRLGASATRRLPFHRLPGPLAGWARHRRLPRFSQRLFQEQERG